MKRSIAIFLLAAMLTGTFAACGSTTAETDAAGETSAVAETAIETEETSFLDALPDADYAGPHSGYTVPTA